MKIVSINDAPGVCNNDGTIRGDVTDIGRIIDNIDHGCGRNAALRAYIYALRDLQRAHDKSAIEAGCNSEIGNAQAAVNEAFDRLIVAEFSVNRRMDAA